MAIGLALPAAVVLGYSIRGLRSLGPAAARRAAAADMPERTVADRTLGRLGGTGADRPEQIGVFETRAPSGAMRPPPATPPAPEKEMLTEIDQVEEARLPTITTERQLDAYLVELEAQARANHKVSALEVQPAIEAIRRLGSTLGPERTFERIRAYSQKMSQLSAELDARDMKKKPVDLDRLAADIPRASTESMRQELIRQYVDSLRELEPQERMHRMERLNQLVADARP
jgi:hypothetical protein